MTGSSYPRKGEKLAPYYLRDILKVKVSDYMRISKLKRELRFCDLDQFTWINYSEQTCIKMANALVKYFSERLHSLPEDLYRTKLPQIPDGVPISRLLLGKRTFSILNRNGFICSSRILNNLRLRDIIDIKEFGAKSILDLLVSIETLREYADTKMRIIRFKFTQACESKDSSEEEYEIDIEDPRFGYLVKLEAARNKRQSGDRLSETILGGSKELKQMVSESGKLNLREELMDVLFAVVRNKRKSEVFARRYGWDGEGGISLEEAGSEFRVTRERTRQICNEVLRLLEPQETSRPFAPTLDRCLQIVRDSVPLSIESLHAKLHTEGLVQKRFKLAGIVSASKHLGRGSPMRISIIGGTHYALPSIGTASWVDLVNSTITNAKRLTEHWGATTVAEVQARTVKRSSSRTRLDFVSDIVNRQQGFKWLDERSGWFWVPSVVRNRLINQIKKMLSVNSKLRISDIREGIARARDMKGFSPPKRVLREIGIQTSGFTVKGQVIIADPHVSYEEVLSDSEKIILHTLQESGPLLHVKELEKKCLEKGMKWPTFNVWVHSSPIVAKIAPEVYCIRGTEIPPGLVESVCGRKRPMKRTIDYGWKEETQIWLGIKVNKTVANTGVFSAPASISKFIQGEYDFLVNRMKFGRLVVKGYQGWGLRPFFSRRGGEPGDVLVLVFNTRTRKVKGTIGDETLLDDFA
jgi:hypothetical protein